MAAVVAAAVLGGARRAGESRRRAKEVVGPAMEDGKRVSAHEGVCMCHEVGAYMVDMIKEGKRMDKSYLYPDRKKRKESREHIMRTCRSMFVTSCRPRACRCATARHAPSPLCVVSRLDTSSPPLLLMVPPSPLPPLLMLLLTTISVDPSTDSRKSPRVSAPRPSAHRPGPKSQGHAHLPLLSIFGPAFANFAV